jgi:ferredoxin
VRVDIDPARCCAAGNCELSFPDLFVVPDEGAPAVFLLPVLPAGREADVEAAAGGCPTGAISLRPVPGS